MKKLVTLFGAGALLVLALGVVALSVMVPAQDARAEDAKSTSQNAALDTPLDTPQGTAQQGAAQNAAPKVAQEPLQPLVPLAAHAPTTRNIVDALAARHYMPVKIDDRLSSEVFDAYLEDLDPSKSYLLASDVREFEVFRYRLDDAFRSGDVTPAFDIFNRYHQRVLSRFESVLAMLEKGVDQFDFTLAEELETDREETPWARSQAELDDLWRRRIKDSVLNLKLTGKETDGIQETLVKRFTNRLSRSRQTNSEDVYQLYMNAFTRTFDPHTQYFSPRTSENFNINMSLSLEGIGAVLQREDEYTKVVSLVPAGPAEKAGELKPNDRIIGVAQGEDGEMIDVIGWRLDEVVSLIRGKKGTVVRLELLPGTSDTESTTISITRNKVKLEEQSAQSEVFEVEQFGHAHRIGVIDIPLFYIDFNALQRGDKDYRSTTRDVANLLHELKTENVAGVVIDLRSNGGGSLQEAQSLVGLFVDQGPTVQVRSRSNRVDILADGDAQLTYDGPLVVLVNRLSASAAEIFAGAIQDYGRGLVIGGQTFGKGTVQSLFPLSRGQLKITQAKFYRISGESTQHRGVIPDIIYPPSYDPEAIGESTLDRPLGWDRIRPANYRARQTISQLMPELRALHDARVKDHPEFDYLRDAYAYRKARSEDTIVPLSEQQRIDEKDEREAFWVALENEKREALNRPLITSLDDLEKDDDELLAAAAAPAGGAAIVPDEAAIDTASDETAPNETDGTLSGSEMAVTSVTDAESESAEDEPEPPDPYLIESGHILLDLISLEQTTAAEGQSSQGS